MPSCPRCKEALIEVASHGLIVLRCSRCKGFVAEKDQISHPHLAAFAASETSLKTGPNRPAEKGFLCPFDGTKMDLFELPVFPKLIAPVCPQCQRVWLDAKKLFDSSQTQKPGVSKNPFLIRGIVLAILLLGLFFAGRSLVTWLPEHLEAGTLRGICMASGVFLFFALCGLGLASQDTDLDGGGGFGTARMAFAAAIASIGDYFWKVLTVLCLWVLVVSFMAWEQHPDKTKRPLKPYYKGKSPSAHVRW